MKKILFLLLLFPIIGFSQPAFVSDIIAYPTVTNAVTITSGNLNTLTSTFIVMEVQEDGYLTSGTITVSSSPTATWVLDTSVTQTGSTHRVSIYHAAVNGSSTSSTQTFTYTTTGVSHPVIEVFAFNWSGTISKDQENGNNCSSCSSIQPGSITPSLSNELFVCDVECYAGSAPSINSSFTYLSRGWNSNINDGSGGSYYIQGSASAINPTWSWGSSQYGTTAYICYKSVSSIPNSNFFQFFK